MKVGRYTNKSLTQKVWRGRTLRHTAKKMYGLHTLRLIEDEERAIQVDWSINTSFKHLDIESFCGRDEDLEDSLLYAESEEL